MLLWVVLFTSLVSVALSLSIASPQTTRQDQTNRFRLQLTIVADTAKGTQDLWGVAIKQAGRLADAILDKKEGARHALKRDLDRQDLTSEVGRQTVQAGLDRLDQLDREFFLFKDRLGEGFDAAKETLRLHSNGRKVLQAEYRALYELGRHHQASTGGETWTLTESSAFVNEVPVGNFDADVSTMTFEPGRNPDFEQVQAFVGALPFLLAPNFPTPYPHGGAKMTAYAPLGLAGVFHIPVKCRLAAPVLVDGLTVQKIIAEDENKSFTGYWLLDSKNSVYRGRFVIRTDTGTLGCFGKPIAATVTINIFRQ